MNHNLNYFIVYCTFVPAENSLNAQLSPMRKRYRSADGQHLNEKYKNSN
ncbi:MAG: hypothetical protein ABI185_06985 [Ginsengibacter sp.]